MGNSIYDPCYLLAPGDSVVVCGASPERGAAGAVRVQFTRPLPQPQAERPSHAITLELANGVRCSWVAGATFGYRGERANYGCTDGGWVFGLPRTGTVWSVDVAYWDAPRRPPLDAPSRIVASVPVRVEWR